MVCFVFQFCWPCLWIRASGTCYSRNDKANVCRNHAGSVLPAIESCWTADLQREFHVAFLQLLGYVQWSGLPLPRPHVHGPYEHMTFQSLPPAGRHLETIRDWNSAITLFGVITLVLNLCFVLWQPCLAERTRRIWMPLSRPPWLLQLTEETIRPFSESGAQCTTDVDVRPK